MTGTTTTAQAGRPPALSQAQIDAMWSPQQDEAVLWQGRPDAMALARSAFHTPMVAGYFGLLAACALAFGGGVSGALITIAAGAATVALLHGIALLCARTTRYILTDRRVILHIGMAIEKTVNLSLTRIGAAHLSDRGKGFGEIALEPAGEHTLGYLLLWPHARPWHIAKPQPMLRALPDAAAVAETLAGAVAAQTEIARAEDAPAPAHSAAPALHGAAA